MLSTTSWDDKASIKQATLRSTIVGLFIGSLVLISNFQFGLQTGWVSMMSLPSALVGCAIFKQIWPLITSNYEPFTDVENVYVQSVAVAVGTGPLAYGFVGVLPAIEKWLTWEESGRTRNPGDRFTLPQLLLWSLALAFFGIFFAVPLRKQVIVREKLPFPSGSATATVIGVFNGSEILQEISPQELLAMREQRLSRQDEANSEGCVKNHSLRAFDQDPAKQALNRQETVPPSLALEGDTPQDERLRPRNLYHENVMMLCRTFMVSAFYTLASYFIPILTSIPVFGTYLSKAYLWNVQLSPAYIGQGMIMGLPTVSYIFFGCVVGWGILAPLARYMRWVSPEVDVHDWENGIQGWIIWPSLAIMIADSLVGFIVFTIRTIVKFVLVDNKVDLLSSVLDDSMESILLEEEREINMGIANSYNKKRSTVKLVSTDRDHEVDPKYLVRYTTVISGWIVSSLICVIVIIYLFGADTIPVYAMVSALLVAAFLSVLSVRALGETDLNPVSGIGKLCQLIFVFIIPKDHKAAVLINLVAGAVAEAGAQQAGDLMQDLKTGHLLGASPRAQFVAQLIGASWSIVLSSLMYIFYNNVYDIPNEKFRVPTAAVWIDCARLVTGGRLPEHALGCSIVLGSIFAILSLLKNCLNGSNSNWIKFIPSGVAVGVGIYNSPSFSIARLVGGITSYWWLRGTESDILVKTKMIVFSSGLILGEGVCSIINMVMTSLDVPHF